MDAVSPLPETRGMRNRTLLAAAIACAALAIPSVASAEDFCVAGPAGCSGRPVEANSLESALATAQTNGSDDRFILAPGVYSADTFNHKSSERVQIMGAGTDKTILRGNLADEWVLSLEGNPGSSVSSLAVQATGGMRGGLLLQGTRAQHVRVGVQGSGFSGWGAALLSGATFDDGQVDIGASDSSAVLIAYAGTVTGSTVHAPAGTGVRAYAGTATVRRSTLRAGAGADADGSRLTIADSLITGGLIGAAAAPGSGGVGTIATVDLDRVTIVGGKFGALAHADEPGEHATVHVRDSVISGVETPVARWATNGAAAASVTTDRSAYPAPAQPIDDGPGSLTETRRLTGNPGFVDEPGGNFHLAADSSLIDAGTPDGCPPAPPTATAARASDGNGDCVPVPDIGAFEYQGRRPRGRPAAGAPPRPAGGELLGQGSCVPGPEAPRPVELRRRRRATGAIVTHAFATAAGTSPRSPCPTAMASPPRPRRRRRHRGDRRAGPRISRLRVAPSRVQIGSALPKLVRTAVKRPLATIAFRL